MARLRVLVERSGLLIAACFVYYAALASRHIVENDNAEFSTLGAVGGVAHPSGYPLYVLWLRLWSWLPASSPAHVASLATVILATIQIGVLHAACRAWGARPLAATFAVGIYATAPLVLRYHTAAEAFALNGLAVAGVLWLAAEQGPLRGARRAFALGLVAGLGLCNHMTCGVVTPLGAIGVWRAGKEGGLKVALPAALAGLAIGLAPYAYLLVAPDNLASWQHPTGISGVVDIALRKQFGGPFGFTGFHNSVPVTDQLAALLSTLARSWCGVFLVVGLATLGIRIARPASDSRAGWIALALSFVIAGPVLASRFNLRLDWWGTYVVERFHLLPTELLVIPVAAGLDLVAQRIPSRPRIAQALVAIGLVANAALSLPYLARFRSPAMENEVRNTLRSLPPDAVVLTGDTELDIGTRYLQLAEHERPDAVYIRWGSIAADWYRARFAATGLSFTLSPGLVKPQVIDQVLATGRPLFVAMGETDGLERYPTYPFGVLVRVLPPGTTPPSLDEIAEINQKLFATFDLAYSLPGKSDEFATMVHRNYARAWKHLGDQFARAGRNDNANAMYELAQHFLPTP